MYSLLYSRPVTRWYPLFNETMVRTPFSRRLLRWNRLVPRTPVLRPPPPLEPQQSLQTRRTSLPKRHLVATSVGGILLPSLPKMPVLATRAGRILLRRMNELRFNGSKLRLPRMHRFVGNTVVIFQGAAPPVNNSGTAHIG